MIVWKGLTKAYGDNVIFQDMNVQFPDTGLVCLLGASGSGKSTLLNLLAGFDTDYSGQILVDGQPLSGLNREQLCAYRRDQVGFVFQNYCLLPGRTVMENVTLPGELYEPDGVTRQEAEKLLERMGLAEKAEEKVESLSGGQKQRAAIARALVHCPRMILADEPTGALDRANSQEIMALLREIAQTRLVVVITHDPKICVYAHQVFHIQDKKLVRQEGGTEAEPQEHWVEPQKRQPVRPSAFQLGLRNFRLHLARYLAVALAVAVGVLAFLFSLSYGNVMAGSIAAFQEKNTAFGSGYIKLEEENPKLMDGLSGDARVEHVRYQYLLQDVTLTLGGRTETMAEKYPMPMATEAMSYGTMPRYGQGEIALTPSLAKKFDSQLQSLVGQTLTLRHGNETYTLEISGIFNAGYDDFFVSTEVEQELYLHTDQSVPYSLSYDVIQFEDVVAVTRELEADGVQAQTAAQEVEAMQNTFRSLQTMFWVVSSLVLATGMFISAVLLVKLQNTRYQEVGLLSALGFSPSDIGGIIQWETLLLTGTAIAIHGLFLAVVGGVERITGVHIAMDAKQAMLSMAGSGVLVMLVNTLAARPLLRTQPADALRK